MELETLKAYIKNNLASKFIRLFKSSAGAPILFDKKSDGSLRLCVDYQGLNNLTLKNQYPLLLVGESLDWLDWAQHFTQLDMTNAYHQIRIKKGDEWKTAFRTRYGYFEYQVMPFGLTNAPAMFQGYINKILAKKLDVFVMVYFNDILIYTESEDDEHVQAVQWVLDQLWKHSLYANLKKCRYHQDEVRFLGYIVSHQSIRIEEEQIKAVRDWLEPQSVRDIQVFLGFANFYRWFIQEFSRLAAPLTSMLKTASAAGPANETLERGDQGVQVENRDEKEPAQKSHKSQITAKSRKWIRAEKLDVSQAKNLSSQSRSFFISKARKAFTKLRQAFVETLILNYFDLERHIRIETDASGYAIGRILSQLTSDDSGWWHPVLFFSRKIIPAKTWYETHNRELLAIVEAFKTWRHYFEGCKHKVLVLTDHNNLQRFMDTKNLSSRQVRWAQELSRYHFQIDY